MGENIRTMREGTTKKNCDTKTLREGKKLGKRHLGRCKFSFASEG